MIIQETTFTRTTFVLARDWEGRVRRRRPRDPRRRAREEEEEEEEGRHGGREGGKLSLSLISRCSCVSTSR